MAATTATVTGIRTGLASTLGTIRGLRTAAVVPEDPKPPIAVVMAPNISYDSAFGRGMDSYSFTVLVVVGRVSDRTAQSTIDAYCSGVGTYSIKAAINSDPTLGGACQSARVTEMSNYGSLSIGDTEYLSAEFTVQVYA
jgi:hypothetical protein